MTKAEPTAVAFRGPAVRAAAIGESLSLHVVVSAANRRTLFGGKTNIRLEGVPVRFSLLSRPEGSEATLETRDVLTDAGGRARTTLRIEGAPGLVVVRAEAGDGTTALRDEVSVAAGVRLSGLAQDGRVGRMLEKPIQVRFETTEGRPRSGMSVNLMLRNAPDGTRLFERSETSGEAGTAGAYVRLGTRQGRGEMLVQLLAPEYTRNGVPVAIGIPFFAIDWWTLGLTVLGGLAIFIFGMRLMSEGLSLLAGDQLRNLLNHLTSNRFLGVLAGTVVTGLIQSSSACSVMVIGFVNAGLMQLEQAIGVIMGANIGTTVTAQMLSFKLGALALPAVTAGVVLSLAGRKSRTRFIAQILIGFGLLFYGMSMMGSPLKQLKDSSTILALFEDLSCAPSAGGIPFLSLLQAVAVGTIMTVTVQSSSASIGLLLTLSGLGLIDVYTGVAVLLGDNIGTTVTALLASIGTSKTAKRAACAHILFNVLGTFSMIALFYVSWEGHPVFLQFVARFTSGDPFQGENLPRFLANAHTLFNVSCTVLMIGFVPLLAWICRRLVPGEEAALPGTRLLERHLLATPSIALQQSWDELGFMLQRGREAQKAGFQAILGTGAPDWDDLAERVKNYEREIDDLQVAITRYVTELSQEVLTEEQSLALPHLLHAVNDAERIGDHSMALYRLAKRVRKNTLRFSPDAMTEMARLFDQIGKLFDLVCTTTDTDAHVESAAEAASLERIRAAVKQLRKQVKDARRAHEQRNASGACDIRSGVIFVDALLNVNRVASHLLNIAEARLGNAPGAEESL